MLSCPKCQTLSRRGGFKAWQIVIAVIFFPIGLLALLADREPTRCTNCGFTWQA